MMIKARILLAGYYWSNKKTLINSYQKLSQNLVRKGQRGNHNPQNAGSLPALQH
jgi:hypothetical protein